MSRQSANRGGRERDAIVGRGGRARGRELDAGRLHVALLLYEGLSKFEFERVEEGS